MISLTLKQGRNEVRCVRRYGRVAVAAERFATEPNQWRIAQMSTIVINKLADGMGERCWGVSVLTDDGAATILESTTPLTKGTAVDTAKVLKQRGPDAPFVGEPPRDHGPAWVPEKNGNKWLLKFTEVDATSFDLLIGDLLKNADIKWNPPDADPAICEKEEETTPAVLDGS